MTNPYEPAPQDPTQRPARLALYFGIISLVLGAFALWRGYEGTATNPLVEAQIPFVISGGLAGLALMLLGGIGIAAAVVLRVTGEIRQELHQTREMLERSRQAGFVHSAPDLLAEAVTASAPLKAKAGSAATNGSVVISASGSSYHLSECRLVERAEETSKVPRADASSQGFVPCRVCNP